MASLPCRICHKIDQIYSVLHRYKYTLQVHGWNFKVKQPSVLHFLQMIKDWWLKMQNFPSSAWASLKFFTVIWMFGKFIKVLFYFYTSGIWRSGRWSSQQCCFRTHPWKSTLVLSPKCLQGFWSGFNVKFKLDSGNELHIIEVKTFTWGTTDWIQTHHRRCAIPDSLRRFTVTMLETNQN